MKQLIQNMKTGKLELKEVPVPLCKDNAVLVKTRASLVSIGTEKSIINLAKKSLLGKAKARPDLFKRALEKAKKEGFLATYKESKERLDEPFPLGYSASGTVIEVGNSVADLHVGDPVAICGSGFANHAEYNAVPVNLCVRLPYRKYGNMISFEEGAFGMVGGICIHAIREADLKPGENVLVIGLGLLGLLTMRIIRSMGSFGIGVDIDPIKVDLARRLGEPLVFNSEDERLEEYVLSHTVDSGVDAAIITAATNKNTPIEIAQKCARIRGKIVLVGVSDIRIDRKAFWEKELTFSVSRGDGPGMLDESYLLGTMDYPIEYVRWTKKRNIVYFLKLLADGKIKIKDMVTHRYPFAEAQNAYKRILMGQELSLGVLFKYEEETEGNLSINALRIKKHKYDSRDVIKKRVVGLIGGGMFAKNFLLPVARKIEHVKLKTIATTCGMTAGHIAEKYGFFQSTTNYEEILKDPEVDTVIVTTRHDSHCKFVAEAIQSGKTVFVEKPLCLNEKELSSIVRLKRKFNNSKIMVGYNRRFSPHAADMKAFFAHSNEPKVINYRINAGYIPRQHWSQDFQRGGGRIIGEVCHFVDLCMYITESNPLMVFAQVIANGLKYQSDDNLVANIQFENGSIASITYTSMGEKSYNRESIEVFSAGSVYQLVDFRKGIRVRNGKSQKIKKLNKDIGLKKEMETFLSLEFNELIPFEDLVIGMITTFSLLESLKRGAVVNVADKGVLFCKNVLLDHEE